MPDWLRSVFSPAWVRRGVPFIALLITFAAIGAQAPDEDQQTPAHGLVLAADTPGSPADENRQENLATPAGQGPTGDSTVEYTMPGWGRVAREYQPYVVVAKSDRFWPVPVETVLGLEGEEIRPLGQSVSSAEATKRYTCLRRRVPCPPPPTLTHLTPDRRTDDYLIYPGKMRDTDGYFREVMQRLDITSPPIGAWISDTASDPYSTAQIYFFMSRTPPKTKKPLPSDLRGNLVNLEYWFFYPYNYLPLRLKVPALLGIDPGTAITKSAGYHEGDFERISVLGRHVRGQPPETFDPRFVFMARHENEGKLLYWDRDPAAPAATHPVVHAGLGGHASYERCGTFERRVGPKLGRVFRGLKLTDYAICQEAPAAEPDAPTGGLFTFGPRTPLVEMKRNSWACWPGRFGKVFAEDNDLARKAKRLSKRYAKVDVFAIIRGIDDGPLAPLRQFENKNECPPASNN